MAVGCRCGTHRHKLFHPLVHFFRSRSRQFKASSRLVFIRNLIWIRSGGERFEPLSSNGGEVWLWGTSRTFRNVRYSSRPSTTLRTRRGDLALFRELAGVAQQV